MRNLRNRLGRIWCEQMHGSTMWPIHGKYRCGTCLREYPVPFEGRAAEQPAATAAQETRHHTLARAA